MKKQIGDVSRPHIITYKIFAIRLKKPLIFAILGVFLALGAVTAYLLIAQPNYIRLNATEYYVLCINSSNSLADAENQSKDMAQAGASGYILSDTSFNITAAAYAKKSDAQTVLSRLKDDYPSAYIKNVKVKKLKIKKTGNKNNDNAIKNLMQTPLDFTAFLLDQSVQLDTQSATESQIMFKLTYYQKMFDEGKKTLTSMLLSYPTHPVLNKALDFYQSIIDRWDYVCQTSTSLGSLNHRIKYFSCLVIDLYSGLRGQIA